MYGPQGRFLNYTIEKFKTWLSNKHETISDLNQLWGTSFADFNNVTIEIPINGNLQGTPKWYDWVTFNNYRVTEWYKWKKSEIQKHDPDAIVHLKIMPNLWSDNLRNHGIDFEALTEMSGISGNDAGAQNSWMWGEPRRMGDVTPGTGVNYA
jgi:beta-galactosidase